ncbi:hypothetical protein LES23_30720 [Pseudomonas aeruginosa]
MATPSRTPERRRVPASGTANT